MSTALRATIGHVIGCLALVFGLNHVLIGSEPPGDRPGGNADNEQIRRAAPIAAFQDGPINRKFGFINRVGEVVLKPTYDNARDFVDGLAQVQVDGKWGFIDVDGKMRVTLPPETVNAFDAKEGMIWYCIGKEKHWGLMDSKGRAIVAPTFDDVNLFSEGMAAVNLGAKWKFPGFMQGGKWGFVDKKGTLVVPIQYESAEDYSEGLARVYANPGSVFLDRSGKNVLSTTGLAGSFRQGLAPIHADNQTRFLDRQGKTQFTVDGWAEEFHEGLAVFSIKGGEAESNEHTSYGYIDRQGKVAIRPRFGEGLEFSEGLAAVRVKKTTSYGAGDTWGYIDKSGAYQIKPEFNQAHPFRGGVALVHIGGVLQDVMHAPPYWKDGEWWLIDQNGKKLKRSWLKSGMP
jgi:hypothetical protein